MARATWVQSSFNGGEWTPLAHGRFDLAKYRNGLELCSNFLPTQQGGLTRRPGTKYVATAKDNTYAPRLVPFEFSATQAYVLVFGHNYIRFCVNDGVLTYVAAADPWAAGKKYAVGAIVSYVGGVFQCTTNHVSTTGPLFPPDNAYWTDITSTSTLPYEVTTTYTSSEIWGLNFAQSADTLYITHPNHPPRKLQRAGATNWVISDVSVLDGPYLSMNVTTTKLTPAGTTGTVAVTASSVTGINGGVGFRSTDVGRSLRIKCSGTWLWGTIASVTDSTHISWTVASPNGLHLPVTAQGIANVSGGSVFSVGITDSGYGYGSTPPSVTFTPKAAVPATAQLTVDGAGTIVNVTLLTSGSGYASDPAVIVNTTTGSGAILYARASGGVIVNLYLAAGGIAYSGSDTISFVGGGSGGGSGAVGYATLSNGSVSDVTMSVTGSGYTSGADVAFSAPTGIAAGASTFWRLGEWNATDGYPSAVAFHQDRLCFSGNAQNPGKVNASNVSDYENFAPSTIDGVITDSSAFSFTLNTGTMNSVDWLVSDENGLLIGTAGGEYVVASSGSQQALTPTNVNAKALSSFGSDAIRPVRVGKSTLFVQRTKRKLRELFYQFTYNTFTAADISLVAEHLTKSGLKQLAVQFAPYQMVWMCRNDSALVGMTYDRDQEVNGWHRHSLGGYSDSGKTLPPLAVSVACIPAPDNQRDEPWLAVNRYINGAVVYTIERMAKVWEDGDALADAVFLDCSATYSGAATTTVTGLTWLIGQTVSVLADGSVHPDCVVSGAGAITLNWAATKVQVGLGYASQAKTLRIEAGGADGPSQGKFKKIFRTVWRFFQTNVFSLWSDAPGVGYEPQAFRDTHDPMGQSVPLYTGDMRWPYDGEWVSDGQIAFQASGPLPCNISLLMAQIDTQDAL